MGQAALGFTQLLVHVGVLELVGFLEVTHGGDDAGEQVLQLVVGLDDERVRGRGAGEHAVALHQQGVELVDGGVEPDVGDADVGRDDGQAVVHRRDIVLDDGEQLDLHIDGVELFFVLGVSRKGQLRLRGHVHHGVAAAVALEAVLDGAEFFFDDAQALIEEFDGIAGGLRAEIACIFVVLDHQPVEDVFSPFGNEIDIRQVDDVVAVVCLGGARGDHQVPNQELGGKMGGYHGDSVLFSKIHISDVRPHDGDVVATDGNLFAKAIAAVVEGILGAPQQNRLDSEAILIFGDEDDAGLGRRGEMLHRINQDVERAVVVEVKGLYPAVLGIGVVETEFLDDFLHHGTGAKDLDFVADLAVGRTGDHFRDGDHVGIVAALGHEHDLVLGRIAGPCDAIVGVSEDEAQNHGGYDDPALAPYHVENLLDVDVRLFFVVIVCVCVFTHG